MRTETGEGTRWGRGRGWRPEDEHRMGTETGAGREREKCSGHGNGDEDGNEDGIGEGGEEATKRKKLDKTCRGDVGYGGDLEGKKKKRRNE